MKAIVSQFRRCCPYERARLSVRVIPDGGQTTHAPFAPASWASRHPRPLGQTQAARCPPGFSQLGLHSKPILADAAIDLRFNLTHAADFVLVALALIPVYGPFGAVAARFASRLSGAALVLASLYSGRQALQVHHPEPASVIE